MKAMILAAGLGTRLKPFTDSHPKALYVVDGKTLLEHAIDHLKSAGIQQVIINVHHFAGQIVEYLCQHDHFGLQISISDETGELLDTGGGVKKASWFFDDADDIIIRNVDIVSDLDFSKIIGFHRQTRSLATLAVRQRETSRYLLCDHYMQLCGWENHKSGERIIVNKPVSGNPVHPDQGWDSNPEYLSSYAFSGMQVMSPVIFSLISEDGKFSLVKMYLRLASEHKVSCYLEEGSVWKDMGSMLNFK